MGLKGGGEQNEGLQMPAESQEFIPCQEDLRAYKGWQQ